MGHIEVLGPNEIQKMSAGSGVVHSEFNGSETEPVHFMQIWIEPKSQGTTPSYEQLKFDAAEKLDQFKLLASPAKVDGAATINQDASVSVAELTPGKKTLVSAGQQASRVAACDRWRGNGERQTVADRRCSCRRPGREARRGGAGYRQ
jgi:hypothetical protein